MSFSVAFGTTPDLSQHLASNSAKFSLDLESGSVASDSSSLVIVHAVFMATAFGVLMPFGILTALYLKKFRWWFPLHVSLQTIALTLAIIGLSLGFVMADESFSEVHHYLGFITV